MLDYTRQLQELEQGVLQLLKRSARSSPGSNIDSGQVYGNVLRTIRQAKQTQALDDVHCAYVAYLQVSKSVDDLRRRQIDTFLDLLGWGALLFVPVADLPDDLGRILWLLPPEWGSPFMQHFIQFWHLEPCHRATIYDRDFWLAWQQAYNLAVRYRAGLALEYIRYLFEVHGHERRAG